MEQNKLEKKKYERQSAEKITNRVYLGIINQNHAQDTSKGGKTNTSLRTTSSYIRDDSVPSCSTGHTDQHAGGLAQAGLSHVRVGAFYSNF